MYKEELVMIVSSKSGLSRATVSEVVDTVSETIAQAMSAGESVQITGFGTFSLKHRNERVGRNPHTGEAVPIPERLIPSFAPGKMLTDTLKHVGGAGCRDRP